MKPPLTAITPDGVILLLYHYATYLAVVSFTRIPYCYVVKTLVYMEIVCYCSAKEIAALRMPMLFVL